MRIYAIGDIHGRLDLLDDLLEKVMADNADRPPADTRFILLGDLIDRGPQSAGVIDRVKDLMQDDAHIYLIKGNHEEVLLHAAHGDPRAARGFLEIGGFQTLQSYGLSDEEISSGSYEDLARLIGERVPADHLAFLEKGKDMMRFGDYVFVHAGIRPGIPLEQQVVSDLRWVRRPFLTCQEDHGAMIIHGHTPTEKIDEQTNRIGIDTGAYASGILTAIGLEEDSRWFVATGVADGMAVNSQIADPEERRPFAD